jgi:Uma2 family endonuclease
MSTVSIPAVPSPSAPERIGPGSNGMLMTPQEFDAIEDYDDCYDYELINGVLIVSPIPLEGEVGPNEKLGYLLQRYQEEHPQGNALDDTLSERYVNLANSRRKADRVIWAGLGRRPNPRVDVPTIVVELVSRRQRDRRRDYIEKRRDYLSLGVKEYWVFNRFERIFTVFQPTEPVERVFQESDIYATPLLPGFELPIAKLQAAADRWEPA